MGSRRGNLFSALRRQRARLGRFPVALFALMSMLLPGAPCFGMVVAGATSELAAASDAHASHDAHDHEHANVDETNAVGQQSSDEHSSGHCPHCPLTGAIAHTPSGAHSFCSADDAVATEPSPSPPIAKHVAVATAFETMPHVALHPPPRYMARQIAPTRSAVALNVRHCVFLI
jgi:hypothetical protein